MIRYTTWGSVCGDCGHEHRTLEAAYRCLRRHQRGCRSQGGYSDREIRRLDPGSTVDSYYVQDGPGQPLPGEEYDRVQDMLDLA